MHARHPLNRRSTNRNASVTDSQVYVTCREQKTTRIGHRDDYRLRPPPRPRPPLFLPLLLFLWFSILASTRSSTVSSHVGTLLRLRRGSSSLASSRLRLPRPRLARGSSSSLRMLSSLREREEDLPRLFSRWPLLSPRSRVLSPRRPRRFWGLSSWSSPKAEVLSSGSSWVSELSSVSVS